LRHTLIGERTHWFQRIRATLFHHGVDGTPEKLRTADGRAFLQRLELPADARERIEIALAIIDALEAQLAPLERELRQLARRQTGCRALMRPYGDGRADLAGYPLRARRRAAAVGLTQGRPPGRHRHRRAPPRPPLASRQAHAPRLTAAALGALRGRPGRLAPEQPRPRRLPRLKARGLSHTRASLTIARKLARRCYHVRHQLGPAALDPIPTT
jgi:transposase